MPYAVVTSQTPLDPETISAVLDDGDLYPNVSLPRTFDRFSTLTPMLTGLGFRDAERLTKAAARKLRKDDRWQSDDGRVFVARVR